MRVLSLFDGISGTQQALKNLGIIPEVYFASEIDKYAIQVTKNNFPDTIQLGDVTKLHDCNFGQIDLMCWGSPCQDLSIAKKDRKGLNGVRSGLFYDAVKIWKIVNPKYWIMENVASMSKEAMHEISKILGVYPIKINSALVSAQNRERYYWTNIKGCMLDGTIEQPKDLQIYLKDIIESGDVDRLKSYCITASYYKGTNLETYLEKGKRQIVYACRQIGRKINEQGKRDDYSTIKAEQKIEINENPEKTNCLSCVQKDNLIIDNNIMIRKLTPIECERLQTYPDNYTQGISNTQRYKCLGNSFTVKVIEHILSHAFK